jgi:uncharacterized cupredoxin-like copper-binding protein
MGAIGVVAQDDATPMASPTVGECVAPELPPGTPTPMDEMDMGAASPVVDLGSPIAEPASPVAEEEAPARPETPAGTPAEGDEAEEIIDAVQNVLNCVNSGNYEGFVALLTTNLMETQFGTGNPYDILMFIEGFSFGEATIENPQTYEDGRVSADVQYQNSEYQVVKERWYLVESDGFWKVDSSDTLTAEVDLDTTVVGVEAGENEDGSYYFLLNAESVVAPGALVLHGRNVGQEPHEIAVVKLPEGTDPAGILDGSVPEEDIEFYGQITLAPGEEGDMTLVGVEPGVLTLVCFFPAPDGTPHAMRGMVAQLEVTEATT